MSESPPPPSAGRPDGQIAAAERKPRTWLWIALIAALAGTTEASAQTTIERVDVALVLAVDVSGSVDDARFVLQMEGVARAYEDAEVQRAILSGRHGALLVTLVNWSHRPRIAIPWTIVASAADAANFAAQVRRAPRAAEDFTCMSLMMHVVADKVLPGHGRMKEVRATANRFSLQGEVR